MILLFSKFIRWSGSGLFGIRRVIVKNVSPRVRLGSEGRTFYFIKSNADHHEVIILPVGCHPSICYYLAASR